MTIEDFWSLWTRIGQGTAVRQHEAAQMVGGSQITYGAGRGVSVPVERISKVINEGSAGPGAQAFQGFGCHQVCV